jgi:tetratricopeptide (TPR) repeat protein
MEETRSCRHAIPSASSLVVVAGAPALGCLWDSDTLLDEKRGLPGVAEILAGRWERHSAFFYMQRVKRAAALIEREPNNLAAYDDLAVAYEKLGGPDRAVELMLRKDKLKPGEYTTEANLGTFYLHKGDLENGIAHIRRALEINPNAHFGREKYQLMAAEYLRDAKAEPAVLDSGSFVMPLLFPLRDEKLGPREYNRFLRDVRAELFYYRPGRRFADTDQAIEGVVGMIRFGTGTAPICPSPWAIYSWPAATVTSPPAPTAGPWTSATPRRT